MRSGKNRKTVIPVRGLRRSPVIGVAMNAVRNQAKAADAEDHQQQEHEATNNSPHYSRPPSISAAATFMATTRMLQPALPNAHHCPDKWEGESTTLVAVAIPDRKLAPTGKSMKSLQME